MTLKIISIGNIKNNELKKIINEYEQKIKHFIKLEIIELKECLINNENSNSEIQMALKKEAENILKYINNKSYLIVLNIDGKLLDSCQLSDHIKSVINNPIYNELIFIIGSSHGLDESIKKIAHLNLSFSKMTFPHQLFKLILLEQIYRSFTIIKNLKYHK